MKLTQTEVINMLNAYVRAGVLTDEQRALILKTYMEGAKPSKEMFDMFNNARHQFLAGNILTISIVNRIIVDLLTELAVDKEFYRQEFKMAANKLINETVKNFDNYYQKADTETKLNGDKIAKLIKQICFEVPKMDYKQWLILIEAMKDCVDGNAISYIDKKDVERLEIARDKINLIESIIKENIKQRNKLNSKKNLEEKEYFKQEGIIEGLQIALKLLTTK